MCPRLSAGAAHATLPNFGKPLNIVAMGTMNISLPDSLKSFVDEQVSQRGYGTSSEYVRELIRKDADRLQLRGLLLEGANSAVAGTADAAYFDALREKVRKRAKPATRR
jgi:antitoxin ParD1/3/4